MHFQLYLNNNELSDSSVKVHVLNNEEELIRVLEDFEKFSDEKKNYILKQQALKNYMFQIPDYEKQEFYILINNSKHSLSNQGNLFENYRIAGSRFQKEVKKLKIEDLTITGLNNDDLLLYFVEGLILADYRFNKYKSEGDVSSLKNINLISAVLKNSDIKSLEVALESVYIARDLVNEPGSVLTATELAARIANMGSVSGFQTEIFDKSRIEELEMGGLLAVNRGSIEPPVFIRMHYKPDYCLNHKPVVLVGKGVVFDTGGLSLKPTLNSMDEMKSDMAGAAIVASVIYAAARLRLPVEIYGLVPATDNRPGEIACLPGDVIKISDGTTVEVLNTDAEGRLILADALSYARQLDPEMVIDIATLTGSASAAIGKYAMVAFSNSVEGFDQAFHNASLQTYERFVQFPLWDEYADLIKSDVADLKNTGGKEAGAITAAKFLEHFTRYKWIHLDIAGVAFSLSDANYQTKGGTGFGVRFLLQYLKSYFNTNVISNS